MAKTTRISTAPSPGTQVGLVHVYDDDQEAKIRALREVRSRHLRHARFMDVLICAAAQYADTLLLPPSDPYREWELRWLNRWDTIPRYMRAAKWDLDNGKKRIKGTMEWRREFKPDLIPPDEVSTSLWPRVAFADERTR